MKLKIDGKDVNALNEFGDCKTLIDTIPALKKLADKSGRIISRIRVDEVELSSSSEAQLKDKPVGSIGLLEVETDSAADLAAATLAGSRRFLDSFKGQVDKFIGVLQTGGEEDSYDVFVDDLKGLSTVLQAVGVVKDFLKSDFSKLSVGDQTAGSVIAGTEDILRQLITALKETDSVYVQDLLRYELIPHVDKIQKLTTSLSDSIGKKSV